MEQWVCAFFPLPRYGHVTLNTAESTNAWLLECRKRSQMKLFFKAIQKVNARFARRPDMYTARDDAAMVDKVLAEIVKDNENGRRLEAQFASDVFAVQSCPEIDVLRAVDLEKRECSCKKFQDMGFPCKHACAAALLAGVDIPSLYIDEHNVWTLRMFYEHGIIPVDIETVPSLALEVPLIQRQVGRPMVNRIPLQIEDSQKKV